MQKLSLTEMNWILLCCFAMLDWDILHLQLRFHSTRDWVLWVSTENAKVKFDRNEEMNWIFVVLQCLTKMSCIFSSNSIVPEVQGCECLYGIVMMNMIKAIEINFIISSLIFLIVKILMSNFWKMEKLRCQFMHFIKSSKDGLIFAVIMIKYISLLDWSM